MKENQLEKQSKEEEKIWDRALEIGFSEALIEFYVKLNRKYVQDFRDFVE